MKRSYDQSPDDQKRSSPLAQFAGKLTAKHNFKAEQRRADREACQAQVSRIALAKSSPANQAALGIVRAIALKHSREARNHSSNYSYDIGDDNLTRREWSSAIKHADTFDTASNHKELTPYSLGELVFTHPQIRIRDSNPVRAEELLINCLSTADSDNQPGPITTLLTVNPYHPARHSAWGKSQWQEHNRSLKLLIAEDGRCSGFHLDDASGHLRTYDPADLEINVLSFLETVQQRIDTSSQLIS